MPFPTFGSTLQTKEFNNTLGNPADRRNNNYRGSSTFKNMLKTPRGSIQMTINERGEIDQHASPQLGMQAKIKLKSRYNDQSFDNLPGTAD